MKRRPMFLLMTVIAGLSACAPVQRGALGYTVARIPTGIEVQNYREESLTTVVLTVSGPAPLATADPRCRLADTDRTTNPPTNVYSCRLGEIPARTARAVVFTGPVTDANVVGKTPSGSLLVPVFL